MKKNERKYCPGSHKKNETKKNSVQQNPVRAGGGRADNGRRAHLIGRTESSDGPMATAALCQPISWAQGRNQSASAALGPPPPRKNGHAHRPVSSISWLTEKKLGRKTR